MDVPSTLRPGPPLLSHLVPGPGVCVCMVGGDAGREPGGGGCCSFPGGGAGGEGEATVDRGGFVRGTVRGAGLGPDKEPSVWVMCPRLAGIAPLRPRGSAFRHSSPSRHRRPRPASLSPGQLNPSPLLGRCRGLSAASYCQPGQAQGRSHSLGPHGTFSRWLCPRDTRCSLCIGQTRQTAQEGIPDPLLTGLARAVSGPGSFPPNHSPPPSSLSEFQLWSRAHGASTVCPPSSGCVESLLDSLQPTPLPPMPSAILTTGGTLLIWEASPLNAPCLLGTALEPGPPWALGSSTCRSQRHAQFYGAVLGQTDLWIQYNPTQNPTRVCVTLLWMLGHVGWVRPGEAQSGQGKRAGVVCRLSGRRCPEN
ncbi:uncharacterized protein LOC125104154 [Lutra lutra]|uniref:uncharacterized protein LOC125104154 n=1 Tax=Lutra lutra TaxID=9657 RepID=UPI001FD3AAE8|nr:uncharacterized protein LOC125104154 [Lutra lutra]